MNKDVIPCQNSAVSEMGVQKREGKSVTDFNPGLSILRTLACFGVVACHFYNPGGNPSLLQKFLIYFREFAVPVFMVMSFALTWRLFTEGGDIRKRLIRLLIPQIGWAIVSFLVLWPASYFAKNLKVGFKDLFWQLLTGMSALDNPLWFQFDLVVLTILFFALRWFLNKLNLFSLKKYIFLLVLFAVASLVSQYSGINFRLCGGLRYELCGSLGRLAEMLPCAVAGFLLGSSGMLGIGNSVFRGGTLKILDFFFCSGMVCIVVFFRVRHISANGFGYSGLEAVAWGACFVVLFSCFSAECVSDRVSSFIRRMGRYTLGIYCMHLIFGILMYGAVDRILGVEQTRCFAGCVVIYLSCYVLCHIISKFLPNGWLKGMVE